MKVLEKEMKVQSIQIKKSRSLNGTEWLMEECWRMIGKRFYSLKQTDSVWWPSHNHRVLYHAGNTYNITFTEEHFLRGLRVHFSLSWHEYQRDVSSITIPYMGVSSTVNSVACEMRLPGGQNVRNHLGISINIMQNSIWLPMSTVSRSWRLSFCM